MKAKQLFLIALLSNIGLNTNASVTKNNVFSSLASYCIPAKSSDFSSDVSNRASFNDPRGGNTCNSVFEGIYNSKNNCGCHFKGDLPAYYNGQQFYHLKWDASIRRCKPNCTPGHYADVRNSTDAKCDSGQYKVKIQRNDSN